MEKSDDPSTENEIWGTCEELLLACAVDRHGTHSWDSIATEIRCRSPYANRLTGIDCKNRFLLLKSRFDGGDGINPGDRSDEQPTVEIPWLDELRKLRVDELRRELRRQDASIGSLELKVKRLKEERERSLVKPDTGGGVNGSGSRSGSGSETEPKESNDRTELPRRSSENMAGDRIYGEDSGLSCKESNSTEPKAEDPKVEMDRIKDEAERAVIGSRSGSVNESVAESKDEGTKESSDVQSSASLSRRRRWKSDVDSTAAVESQPLIDFLELIRSNKDGSVFNRRLESQEGVRYRSLIRRHVDLDLVGSRIGTNGYTSTKFFRDLLLLCNNALVFFPKNSSESISALHLRDLINKEIATKLRKTPQPSPQSTEEPPLLHPLLPPSKLKLDPDRVNVEKPAALPPLVACRKRSSIAAKPAKPVKPVKNAEKGEKMEIEEEGIEKDEVVDKKSTKQRTTFSRKLRTCKGGGGGGASVVKDPNPDPVQEEAKPSMKKRGAANFLNRIKLSPSSSNGKGNEAVTKSSASLSKGGGEAQKKKLREESKKQNAAAVAAAAAAKRNVGRPPKRGAASTKRAREEKTPPLPRKRGRR